MNIEQIIKAWKDPEYRANLTGEQVESLPAHPSGSLLVEIDVERLTAVNGGHTCNNCFSHANSCGWICTHTTECGCHDHIYSCNCSTGACLCYGDCS